MKTLIKHCQNIFISDDPEIHDEKEEKRKKSVSPFRNKKKSRKSKSVVSYNKLKEDEHYV